MRKVVIDGQKLLQELNLPDNFTAMDVKNALIDSNNGEEIINKCIISEEEIVEVSLFPTSTELKHDDTDNNYYEKRISILEKQRKYAKNPLEIQNLEREITSLRFWKNFGRNKAKYTKKRKRK